MATKVAINGFGRIGRAVARILMQREDMELVAINDLAPAKSLAHLFKYDTVFGPYQGTVEGKDDAIVIDGKTVTVTAVRNPKELPWGKMGVEVVVEATGIFRDKASLQKHLDAGAGRVVLTVPPKEDIDYMVVLGVNDDGTGGTTLNGPGRTPAVASSGVATIPSSTATLAWPLQSSPQV